MREILHLLPRPAHYCGIEEGAVHKDSTHVDLHIALAFPDIYEVGMSYLGQKILYNIVNGHSRWWAERVMAPEYEACRILRDRKILLSTLESDTPLRDLAAVCFSVTHELCYPDILNMLDLAQIPLRASDRPDDLFSCPVIMAGGGAMFGAEPISPFFDLVALGDGEELLPEILEALQKARKSGFGKKEFLRDVSAIPGVYVPSFFKDCERGGYEANSECGTPVRRIVADLNDCSYPVAQIAPLGAVHNRLSLEIGRGCTRGCRFCHAGMVYRPARERTPAKVDTLIAECLKKTGFDEVSFMALSAGDCTALKTLYSRAHTRCQKEQIALCLPSLRVGSVDDEIMERMAELKRPGATLAPEAGSQRLRDIINKGISEEDILLHIQKLIEYGWRQVKLYFMIGLPGETDADLDAIIELCKKVRVAGGHGAPKLAVTASVSPFVPKPFTPFQWEAQPPVGEITRRIMYLREGLRREKGIRLKWHEPAASHLEGILARGDRRLADVIERAFRKGAVFCGWNEYFNFAPWQEALDECGLSAESYIRAREKEEKLPWSHIEAGVTKEFLWREREKAYLGITTSDCKFGKCGGCGACDIGKSRSLLAGKGEKHHRLVFPERDQESHPALRDEAGRLILRHEGRPHVSSKLIQKTIKYRIWHCKKGGAAWLSHLELQALITRALRRANIPVAFSQGFHPMPLISFGRALPVGVASLCEWFEITLHDMMAPGKVLKTMQEYLPAGLYLTMIEAAPKKLDLSISEIFSIELENREAYSAAVDVIEDFCAKDSCVMEGLGKNGEKSEDIRKYLLKWQYGGAAKDRDSLFFTSDWLEGYISPLVLARSILGWGPEQRLSLLKMAQAFANGKQYGEMPKESGDD